MDEVDEINCLNKIIFPDFFYWDGEKMIIWIYFPQPIIVDDHHQAMVKFVLVQQILNRLNE